jgi:hypothetical protein
VGLRAKLSLLIFALLAIAAIALWRSHAGAKTRDVDPHAAEEIEKAQRR